MPNDVLPALPARCTAEASDMGTVAKEARLVLGLYVRI